MDAVTVAFVVVFFAELGDKTQLVALSLATRYPLAVVLGGITVAFAFTQGVAALLGGALGATLPTAAVGVGAAALFFAFAVWTWLDAPEAAEAEAEAAALAARSGTGLRAVAAIVVAMAVAEIGDKTMLATATLAADRGALGTWVGATLGVTASGALAVLVGRWLGARIPERTTRRLAAGLFVLFGVLLLFDTLR
jgi:Ca2+/H+ antiporter, TMEM165/GDT1 family